MQNKKRDTEGTQYYKEKEWTIVRICEHEVKDNFDMLINKILEIITQACRDI